MLGQLRRTKFMYHGKSYSMHNYRRKRYFLYTTIGAIRRTKTKLFCKLIYNLHWQKVLYFCGWQDFGLSLLPEFIFMHKTLLFNVVVMNLYLLNSHSKKLFGDGDRYNIRKITIVTTCNRSNVRL